MDKQLVIGKVYAVLHKRKGHFKAQLIDIVPGDGENGDDVFLTMKMDTRQGSGQQGLARSANAKVTVTNIRPSLVVKIEEMDTDDWLIRQRVVEEERPKVAAAQPKTGLAAWWERFTSRSN